MAFSVLLMGCADDQRALTREIAAMPLLDRGYGEAYATLTKVGFDCGAYLHDRSVTAPSRASPLRVTCHRTLRHRLGCDSSQLVYLTGEPDTWRIHNVWAWSGGACY